jgi:C-methyltransferase C-terminal domain/Putative zinc binding domain/Methyltransferase domain
MYKTVTQCRACQSTDLTEVFSFDKPLPLANDFVKPGGERQGFVPVRILFCRECTLAQLGEVVSPEILYKNYLYVTSSSETMRRHFDRLLKDLVSENGKGSILEAGSNDGLFLEFASKNGFKDVVGVDPAENLGQATVFPRINGVFYHGTAARAMAALEKPKVDYIVARHCFCHQEWTPFMEACTVVAHAKTLIAIEVPYAPDLLRKTEFDSIYSEHTSYLTIKSIVALLKRWPFHLHGVLRYGVHGGAVLLMLRHNDSGIQPHLSADEMLHDENVTETQWVLFGEKTRHKIENISKLVRKYKEDGQIVSAFGASAKASVLISACGFTDKEIAFVSDNSPLKPGRLMPGTSIPVIEESEMLSHHPDYAIMTAWNYEKEICAKMQKWRDRGGKFIIPDDQLRIV